MDENFVFERIEELCKRKGLSKYKLSLLSGVHESSLSTAMNHNTTPNIYTIEKLCKAFDMTLAQFFSSDEDKFCGLPEDQQYVLTEFDKLNELDKKLTLAFMQGLTDSRTKK